MCTHHSLLCGSPLGHRIRNMPLLALGAFVLVGCLANAQTPVVTRSYDNGRTGANIAESNLTGGQILQRGLTKLYTVTLAGDDPRIEAQPLYVPHTQMSDGKSHNVLFVFSMSNHVWAFDADTGVPIWSQPILLAPPFIAKPGDPVDSKGINVSFGILSTPVIDLDTNTMYVVYWKSDAATHQSRQIEIAALNLSDGQPKPGKPAADITASIKVGSTTISLDQVQKQRSALLLTPLTRTATPNAGAKMLYVAVTGSEAPEGTPAQSHHGWVIAFDVDHWKQVSQWVSTPSSFGGGIWQASQGPAADDQGNVYLMTANGGYSVGPGAQDFNGKTDFAESFVKLALVNGTGGPMLSVVDWFSPFRDSIRRSYAAVAPSEGYDYGDQDLGSAGPVLPPGTSLVLGAGKDGILFVFDRNNLGKSIGDFSKLKTAPVFFTYDPDPSIAAFAGANPASNCSTGPACPLDFKPMLGVKTHHLHGSPVYWNSNAHGPMLFAWGENGNLRAYLMDANGKATLAARGVEVASANLADPAQTSLGGMPGGMLALSAQGGDNGLLWATIPAEGDANAKPVPGLVLVYDAVNFLPPAAPGGTPQLHKLWQAGGFTYSKFCPPVVADGKLFVPTYDGRVDVYALTPVNTPAHAKPIG